MRSNVSWRLQIVAATSKHYMYFHRLTSLGQGHPSEGSGKLVVLLRGVNHGQNATIFSHHGIF